jgi:hypothetical protein
VSESGSRGSPGETGAPVQRVGAARDSYVAGRDQYVMVSRASEQKARVGRLPILSVTVVAIGLMVVFVLWRFGQFPPHATRWPIVASGLEIDSITFESYDQTHSSSAGQSSEPLPGPVTFDFKLRDTGTQVSLITGIDVRVSSVEFHPPCLLCLPMLPVSATYGYVLPLKAGPTREIPLSEVVEPDGVDRFDLNLQLPPGTSITSWYNYVIYMSLIYNDNQHINIGYESFTIYGGR